MKLVGYCRVSSDGQADNTSLGEQQRQIEAYCQAFGHELISVYTEVGSGKSATDRPQLQMALKNLDTADGLVVAKLDRLARSNRDMLTMIEDDFAPAGKSLILLDLQIDTSTPAGKMMLSVMAAVAEMERSQINTRTRSGQQAKAKAGGYYGGAPEFGRQADGNGNKVSNPAEMEIIEVVRRHRKSGKSLGKIADFLNDNGYPSKRGGRWSASAVRNVLLRAKKQA